MYIIPYKFVLFNSTPCKRSLLQTYLSLLLNRLGNRQFVHKFVKIKSYFVPNFRIVNVDCATRKFLSFSHNTTSNCYKIIVKNSLDDGFTWII